MSLTTADYEEVLADKRRLVREYDVMMNGEGAAEQASLCDLGASIQAILDRTTALELHLGIMLEHADRACGSCDRATHRAARAVLKGKA